MKIHQKLNKEFTVDQAFIILSAQKAKIYEKQIFVQEATKSKNKFLSFLVMIFLRRWLVGKDMGI